MNQPTKPPTIDEILLGYGRWIAGEIEPDGVSVLDHTQAKDRLIELVESVPTNKSYPLLDDETLTIKLIIDDFRQALIKTIKGGK